MYKTSLLKTVSIWGHWEIIKYFTSHCCLFYNSSVRVFYWIIVYYSCGLSTATIEYSCPSACLRACFRLSVCVHDNSKNNGSIHLKLEHIVVFENSSDEFDNGHCPIKVKVMA